MIRQWLELRKDWRALALKAEPTKTGLSIANAKGHAIYYAHKELLELTKLTKHASEERCLSVPES